jgi:hypothetical protein
VGVFDWLFGPTGRKVPLRDRIWLSKSAKFHELVKVVADEHRSGENAIVLVAHFPETLDLLQLVAARFETGRPVVATLARELTATLQQGALRSSTAILFLVGERHPHAAYDEALLNEIKAQPQSCRVEYHVALDDAMMRAFAGEWVVNTLRSLGMKEDEALESPMVTRRILAAQKKVASESMIGNDDASSAEEWMQRNCPQLLKKT